MGRHKCSIHHVVYSQFSRMPKFISPIMGIYKCSIHHVIFFLLLEVIELYVYMQFMTYELWSQKSTTIMPLHGAFKHKFQIYKNLKFRQACKDLIRRDMTKFGRGIHCMCTILYRVWLW